MRVCVCVSLKCKFKYLGSIKVWHYMDGEIGCPLTRAVVFTRVSGTSSPGQAMKKWQLNRSTFSILYFTHEVDLSLLFQQPTNITKTKPWCTIQYHSSELSVVSYAIGHCFRNRFTLNSILMLFIIYCTVDSIFSLSNNIYLHSVIIFSVVLVQMFPLFPSVLGPQLVHDCSVFFHPILVVCYFLMSLPSHISIPEICTYLSYCMFCVCLILMLCHVTSRQTGKNPNVKQ